MVGPVGPTPTSVLRWTSEETSRALATPFLFYGSLLVSSFGIHLAKPLRVVGTRVPRPAMSLAAGLVGGSAPREHSVKGKAMLYWEL